MKKMVCIVCPNSCVLSAEEKDGSLSVTGGACPRGKEFAISEITDPKRMLCSTVKTVFPGVPVLPVRVSAEIPKDKIFEVMAQLNKIVVRQRIARGDAVIPNVLGLGVDIIATSSVLKDGV